MRMGLRMGATRRGEAQGNSSILRHVNPAKLVTLICIALAILGCSDGESPEAQVRHSIDAMEKAAEERDVSALTEHVSEQFHDAYGRGRKELAQYVRGYFIAHQSIHLLTRINSIEFPSPDEARVQVTVAMVGRDAEQSNAWNLAGEIHDFDVTFMRNDDEWQVTYFELRR